MYFDSVKISRKMHLLNRMNRVNSKTNYHHGSLRKALIDAGEKVLAEVGFSGFTLRACARRALVSHSAPKHHFGDVSGLLTAIAARGFERLSRQLRREMKKAASLEEEFSATSRAYLRFAERYPEHFRIMFRSDLVDKTNAELQIAAADTFVELTNVIMRQTGKPEVNRTEVMEADVVRDVIDDIMIGWCHIHGLAHLRLEQQFVMVPGREFTDLVNASSTRLSRLLQEG